MTPPQTQHRKGSRTRRAVVSAVLAVSLSAGGAAAWALDRFVIPHAQITNVSEYEASQAGTTTTSDNSASRVVTDTSYTQGDTGVTISTVTTGSGDSTVTYYVADVVLSDATALKSAFAQDTYGENITETTSAIAQDHNAIFAINGDYYGFRDTGIVIRNGVVYRDEGARQGLAFYKDGTVKVYDETTTTADQLIAEGVWNTLSFGPSLLNNGEIASGIEDVEVDTNFGNHSIQGEQPRTAVGVIDQNHLVFVVVDGRSPGYSAGVTMTGLAQIMKDLGATTAYNIDGGGSSTMYFNGSLVNNPLGENKERGTSDILYIAQ
ncbi:exopolysaccharide biosynthesis protein [Paenarthrobacter nicotinovorans]|uniref:phosphodiester glycosidase family protein n=1 Tax=Paenarthrobacter nicotinovorans TaxID=29320 RepID=UPI00278552EB|nr:phosphodiester glycosidase family protein [Paenarthrobacter nicotinovorans]MDP9933924.1 exopolysaccharide biosynthesis protein [Paenarthrobacter nicotinovorans]